MKILNWRRRRKQLPSENPKGGTISLSYLHSDPNLSQSFVTLKEINKVHLPIMGNVKYGLKMNPQLIGTGLLFEQFSIDEPPIRLTHYP